jgi:hypothetical protein
MSNITWFKIFSENGKPFIVAYAGAEAVEACRADKKQDICNFLKRYPNAHNVHVAGEEEAIPRATLIDINGEEDPRWIPFAKTPHNDSKLKELQNRLGHPHLQGKYRHGWPEGMIYHHTAGRTNPYGTIEFLWTRYPCLVVGRDGTLYQPFPLDEWGYHSGTWHHQSCVGVEVIGAGLLKPVTVDGVTKYAPWFVFNQNTGELVEPDSCLDQSQCRHIEGNSIRTGGWYEKFTPAQEETVAKLCLYLKTQRPDIFSFDKIKGHDEAVAEDRAPHCKNDPGGSLSTTMDELRRTLKAQYVESTR